MMRLYSKSGSILEILSRSVHIIMHQYNIVEQKSIFIDFPSLSSQMFFLALLSDVTPA